VAAARRRCSTARAEPGLRQVTAPIAGRIGRALVTEGALVSAAEATQLALIQQIDQRLRQLHAVGGRGAARCARWPAAGCKRRRPSRPVRVLLDDGSELPQRGRLLFSDLSVDPSSAR
jgi:membrane fusion protein (multidrug efflux system)